MVKAIEGARITEYLFFELFFTFIFYLKHMKVTYKNIRWVAQISSSYTILN